MSLGVSADTYKRHQEDILAFTSWLAIVAQSCGWKPVPKPQASTSATKPKSLVGKISRLKGRDRKQAKDATKSVSSKPDPVIQSSASKQTVTADELLELATLISNKKKGKSRFPNPIQRVLENAIKQRKKCAAWFRLTDVEKRYIAFSNENLKLIDVFEKVVSVLGENVEQPVATENPQPGQPTTVEADELSNYFCNLSLEATQVEESLPTLSDILALLAPSPGISQTTPLKNQQYELVTDPGIELKFQVFCLFDDLHILRGEIQKAWHAYKAGTMTLVVATILTTIAVQLIAKIENELITANENSIKPSQSYHDLVSTIFHSEYLDKKIDPEETWTVPGLELSPITGFILLSVGQTLVRVSKQQTILEKVQYPAPILSMSEDYTARPELLKSSHMKKAIAEDELICQLVLDFTLLDEFKDREADHRKFDKTSELQLYLLPTFDDIFTDAVEPVWKHGQVTVRSVFAARLLLDILNICPDFDGAKLLQGEGQNQNDLFEFCVDDDGVFDMRSGFRWLTKDVHLVKEIYDRITRQMINNKFTELKTVMLERSEEDPQISNDTENVSQEQAIRHKLSAALRKRTEENAKKRGVPLVRPSRDTKLHLNRNPLFCGTLLLSQNTSIEAASITLANHHLSILAVAHLYNALRKMELIDIVWPDMEKIIDLQKGPIFADDVPETPEEMRARIFFRLGTDRTFTRATVDETSLAKRNMYTSLATELLLQFFRSDQSLGDTMLEVQQSMQQRQLMSTQNTNKPGFPSLRQSMTNFEAFTKVAISETKTPYLGMTKICIYYLQYVRKALQANGCIVPPRTNPQDSNDQSLVFMAADILQNNSMANNKACKKKTPGRQLELAAVEFRRMWEYLNSERFEENRPLYFLERNVERGKAVSKTGGYVRGW